MKRANAPIFQRHLRNLHQSHPVDRILKSDDSLAKFYGK